MSLSPHFPLECLLLILEQLQSRQDFATLSCLLQVNSYFYTATLPYFYGGILDNRPVPPRITPRYSRATKVVQTLLRQRPLEEISELLRVVYDLVPEVQQEQEEKGEDVNHPRTKYKNMTVVDPTQKDSRLLTAKKKTMVDYLSLVRTFIFESSIYLPRYTVGFIQHQWTDYPPRIAKYVNTSKSGHVANGIGDGCHDHELLFPPPAMAIHFPEHSLRYGALATALRRDLTWTLGSPVFEQIQELMIPLSDVDRYLKVVERFQSLVSVHFKMDELLESVSVRVNIHQGHPLFACLQRRERQFRTMISFVQRHTQLFPNLLRAADCPPDKTWPTSLNCPLKIDQELQYLLPALVRPISIDNQNYTQIASKIQSTNLGSVEMINLNSRRPDGNTVAKMLAKDPTFLQRCRALKSLQIISPGAGTFRWAVEERRAWDRFHQVTAAAAVATTEGAPNGQHRQLLELKPPLPPLIPLKEIAIDFTAPCEDELDDLALAFGATLTTFYANSGYHAFARPEFHIGQGWSLPEVEHLKVTVQRNRLVVDPDFFALGLGDKLRRLELADKLGFYRCQDIETCRPALTPLSALIDLALQGWPALTFHPDTLRVTSQLQNLRVEVFGYRGQTFIPPVEELMASFQRHPQETTSLLGMEEDSLEESTIAQVGGGGHRPLWTWDWHLPQLRTLRLASEFAYMFQFRMLLGCPSLENLSLVISTDDQLHERRLSLQDFLLPDSATPSDPSKGDLPQQHQNQGRFLVAPKVKELHLYGNFIIEDEVLDVMYGITFAKMMFLVESQTKGYSLDRWLSLLHCSKTLKEASFGLYYDGTQQPYLEEALVQLGLVSVPPPSCHMVAGERVDLPDQIVFYIGGRTWSFAEDVEGQEDYC